MMTGTNSTDRRTVKFVPSNDKQTFLLTIKTLLIMATTKVEATKVAENNEQAQYINDNIGRVPKNQMKRFMTLSMDEQVNRIKKYIEREQWIAEQKEKSKIVNRVKEMFEKRKASLEDAKEVIDYCTEYINSNKQREMEKLEAEIARLMKMKESLNA